MIASRLQQSALERELGPLVCQRQASKWYLIGVFAFGIPAIASLAGAIVMSCSSKKDVREDAAALYMLAFIFTFLALAVVGEMLKRIGLFERGIVKRWGPFWKAIRYDQVESMQFRMFAAGSGHGDVIPYADLILWGAGLKLKYTGPLDASLINNPVTFRRKVVLDLLWVRDTISELLADALERELSTGNEVAWPGVGVFDARGLVPLIGARRDQLVEFRSIDRIEFERGKLRLFEHHIDAPILHAPTWTIDFWPCLTLVQRRIDAAAPEAIS